jgi:hypothetical protein
MFPPEYKSNIIEDFIQPLNGAPALKAASAYFAPEPLKISVSFG